MAEPGTRVVDPPRRLSDDERATLEYLLGDDAPVLQDEGPGRAELRSQIAHARVVGECTCGCPSVDLVVDPAATPAHVFRGLLEAYGRDETGRRAYVHVFVTADGYLSGLEYYNHDEDAPPARVDPGGLSQDYASWFADS